MPALKPSNALSVQVRLSGLREAYFGTMFREQQTRLAKCIQRHGSGSCRFNASAAGLAHIARFVESFETPDHDLWLVSSAFSGKYLSACVCCIQMR